MNMDLEELVTEGGWQEKEAKRFIRWSHAVNEIVMNETGVEIDEGPDWDQASCFEDRMSPRDAANYCMDQWGYFRERSEDDEY